MGGQCGQKRGTDASSEESHRGSLHTPPPHSSVSLREQPGIQAGARGHRDDNSHPFDLEQFRLIVVVTDFWFGGMEPGVLPVLGKLSDTTEGRQRRS